MKWDEDQIRESLRRGLDSVDVPIQIPKSTLKRARSRRVASSGGALLVIMVVGVAAAWGALSVESGRRQQPVNPSSPPPYVRLLTEPPTRGLIEIEASRGQACYRFEMRGSTSAHIREQGSSDVLVDLPVNQAGNYALLGCVDGLDSAALQQIAERPNEHLVEFHDSVSGGSEAAILTADVGDPDCLPTELTSPEYGLHFSSREGKPGEQVRVWGTTLRTEGGDYARSDRLELWWNADAPDENRPKEEGKAIQLASVVTGDRCYFMTSFNIPDVPEARYEITGFIWEEPPSEGYGVFLGTNVRVVSSDLPPCDDDQSYGQTIPGRWLEDVIVDLGGPGGYDVTDEEVKDTGTALEIDVPAYGHDPTIYATMLTPGDDPNITSSPPEVELGKRGGYTLYLQNGNPWESYKAVGEDWQLSLIAYPGVDSDQVAWPDATRDWLTRAVDLAQESPPQCSGPLS